VGGNAVTRNATALPWDFVAPRGRRRDLGGSGRLCVLGVIGTAGKHLLDAWRMFRRWQF
jgi:hypothetical protein